MKIEELIEGLGEAGEVPPPDLGPAKGNGGADQEQERRPPAFSDEALALVFAEQYAARLRYVAKWSRWMIWNGKCWTEDETLQAFNLACAICRAAASECNKGKIATTLASAKTVAAIERLAKADRRLAATVDQWDADPWLLNTPGGTINLRTGERYQSRASDYITQSTAVAPGGDCPLWLKFLARITGGDRTLQDYIQRLLGYALTGLTIEHALFFLYGTGAQTTGRTTAFLRLTVSAPGEKKAPTLGRARGAETAHNRVPGSCWRPCVRTN